MKRILTIAVALVAGLLVLGGQALAASPALVVDDDDAQCENANHKTIQDAVDEANPGDKIRVCPGLYAESVQVDKTLFLRGEGPKPQNRPQTGDGNPAEEAIVDPPNGAPGFNVVANEVKIKGFTVTGAQGAPGIQTSATNSGYEIRKNLIRDNTFGLYLNSNGELESQAAKNLFRNNNEDGAAAGNGVYSDQGLSNATINNNLFTKHQNAPVILVGNAGTQSEVTIKNNDIIDDRTIILANVTDSKVNKNLSEGSSGSAIFLAGGVQDTRIKKNDLRDGVDSGIRSRANAISPAPNSNNLIERNDITRFGFSGLSFTTGSFENTIRANTSLRNEPFDCFDDTTGNGTAGTANFWEDNTGRTENRPGLCERNRN